jgi:hypothetical protein
VAHKFFRPTQSAFISRRNILEGVVILHGTIHEIQKEKMDGDLFKIDFEKPYDKVKWSFFVASFTYERFPS